MRFPKAIFAFALAPAGAFATVPAVSTQDFHGLQSGTKRYITFTGKNLRDAQDIIFARPGITASDPFPGPGDKDSITFKVSAAASTHPGEYPYRIRSNRGLSYLHILKVGTYPEFDESASKIPLDQDTPAVTINGTLSREESDQFTVALEKGQRIALEVEGIRLGTHTFDPHISILSASGETLARADDSTLFAQDPHLEFTAPEVGNYSIVLRDSTYSAQRNSPYRLHIGDFPNPKATSPPGRNLEKTPPLTNDGFAEIYPEEAPTLPPNGSTTRITSHTIHEEQEPNNQFEQAQPPTPITSAFHGKFDHENDYDYFAIQVTKGTTYSARSFAHSLGSPADLILDLFNQEKKHIKGADDFDGNPDPSFTFKAESDGTYYIRTREHLHRFGDAHFYRFEVDKVVPSLALSIPQFDRNDSQARQMLAVPRGGRVATLINITRTASKGSVTFQIPAHLQGLTLLAPTLPANATQIPLVFEAQTDAPLAAAWIDLQASLEADPTVTTGFTQRLDLPRVPGNRRPYRTLRQEKLPLAVVDALPFSIAVTRPAVPLVQRGNAHLDIKLTREEGFDETVVLRLLGRPPGFGTNNTVTIAKDKDTTQYPINANGKAAAGLWHLAIQAESGGAMNASPLIPLTIEEDYLSITAPLVKTAQGSTTEMVCEVTIDREFEGEATAKLTGLPAHTTSAPVTFKSGQETLKIPITTTAKSPLGVRKNLRVTVEIPHAKGTIIQTAYQGGRIRIDPPKIPKLVNQ